MRYAYEQFDLYFPPGRTRLRGLKAAAIARLRRWDIATAARPTRYLANSSAVAERIRRHYGREATVCHPPVDVDFFTPGARAPREDFLLAVGALVPYKRFEVAIEAAARLGRPLVLVGTRPRGEAPPRPGRLRPSRFRAGLRREELRAALPDLRAFVQPGEEDFGIAAVEAVACGAPVVALARGGARDIVGDGADGVLYEGDGAEALAAAVAAGRPHGSITLACGARRSPFGRSVSPSEFRGSAGEIFCRDPKVDAAHRACCSPFPTSATTLAALAAAYVLRFRAEIVPVTKGIPDAASYYRLFPLMAVLWPIVYYFYGLYQVRRHRSRIEEGLAVLVATGLATLLLTGLATFYRGFSYSRLVLLFFFALDVLFVFAGRTAIRRYLEEAWRHGVGVRHVLVVGAGRLGRAVVDKLVEHPEAGLRAVGFVDDDPGKRGRATAACRSSARRRRSRGSSTSAASTRSSWRCRSRRTARCSRS